MYSQLGQQLLLCLLLPSCVLRGPSLRPASQQGGLGIEKLHSIALLGQMTLGLASQIWASVPLSGCRMLSVCSLPKPPPELATR